MDIKEIEELLIQLESKIAFQDATIEELNQVVTQQQIEISRFKRGLKNRHRTIEVIPIVNARSP